MKRSGDKIDDYSGEFYQSSLRYIEDYTFVNRVFAEAPALVTRHDSAVETKPYAGEPYDPSFQTVEPKGWNHEHCYVCGWEIDAGYSYWENTTGLVLCDECHEFVVSDPQHGKR